MTGASNAIESAALRAHVRGMIWSDRDGASFAPGMVYRYLLWRQLPLPLDAPSPPRTVIVCMLNPSTADGATDDPTVRRCKGFAARENAHRLIVVNLFGYCATDPKALAHWTDPVGPWNDDHIQAALHLEPEPIVIAAWGADPAATPERAETALYEPCARLGLPVFCLGTTVSGAPSHPLYIPKDRPLELLRPAPPNGRGFRSPPSTRPGEPPA